MNYIEYMQQPAGPITPTLQLFNIPIITAGVATSKPSQDKTAKQILKDGGSFLKYFPLKEVLRYRQLAPGNYTTPKIFKS